MAAEVVDFKIPTGWNSLTDDQLSGVYDLMSSGFFSEEVKLLSLFKWTHTTVIGRTPSGAYILVKDKSLFSVSTVAVAEILPELAWLDSFPEVPVRLSSINRRRALPADFSGVPFETFIVCDNLYQGYLHTKDEALLDELGGVLYPKGRFALPRRFKPLHRVCFFYWFAALKDYFSRRFPDFFQPMAATDDGNLLASPSRSVEAAMNAQIRALTKGDVTKEAEVLALDTIRALTELDAQAREYKEIKSKKHK